MLNSIELICPRIFGKIFDMTEYDLATPIASIITRSRSKGSSTKDDSTKKETVAASKTNNTAKK